MSSLILCNNNESFLHWTMTFIEKWILYNSLWWSAQWLDQEEAPKYFPKPNLHHRKSWSLFGGLLPMWSTTAFPVKTLHLRSMLNKLVRCMKNCNTAAGIGQQKRSSSSPQQYPSAHCTTNASKVEWIELWNFASSATFTWPLANQPPLLQTSWPLFAEKTLPQTAGGRKCIPKVCQVLKHRLSCYRNKQTYFSLAKTGWL